MQNKQKKKIKKSYIIKNTQNVIRTSVHCTLLNRISRY